MMVPRVQRIFLFFLLIFSAFFHFASAQEAPLKKYTCLTKFISIEGWEAEKNVSFDSSGIILTGNKYHPLNITQYGIICFYRYLETNDTVYRDKFLSQVGYFRDTSKVNLLYGDRAIGLPYTSEFKGLKPPWYSGMTQGNAISLLLRYYVWSQDSTIRPVIQKIAYLLLMPETAGGTISKTPEGLTWIEEYPNLKHSRQVLNGFINGWIGLFEYCMFFPEDTVASRIRDESLHALKSTLNKYESLNGVLYNRSKSFCTNSYIRYQILEMEQLYELTGEELFRKQMMLWSFLIYKKPNVEKGTRTLNKDFNFSVPLKELGYEKLPDNLYRSVTTADYKSIAINGQPLSKEAVSQVLSRSPDSAFLYKAVKAKFKKKLSLQVNLTDSVSIDRILLMIDPAVNEDAGNIHVLFPNGTDTKSEHYPVHSVEREAGYICMDLPDCCEKTFEISVRPEEKINEWHINNLVIYPPADDKIPYFTFYLSNTVPPRHSLSVTAESRFAGDPVVFYRSNADSSRLDKTHWKVYDSFTIQKEQVKNLKPDLSFYQFLVVFEINGPHTSVTSVKIGEQ